MLREAYDLCGLPVAVFRCDPILADTTFAGFQLNVPDNFTRMVLSVVATGLAPASFLSTRPRWQSSTSPFRTMRCPLGSSPRRSPAGLADGLQVSADFETYHVMEPARRRNRHPTNSSTG